MRKVSIAIFVLLGLIAAAWFFYLRPIIDGKWVDYFESDVVELETQAEENAPPSPVIFYGSSTIRLWPRLDEALAPLPTVNHGFGGANLAQAAHYRQRLVDRFEPEMVVVYIGSNDIHGLTDSSATGEDLGPKIVQFLEGIRTSNPDMPVLYMAILPSPMRLHVWKEAQRSNAIVAQYAEDEPTVYYVDLSPEITVDGEPDSELFSWDHLHLNEDGYARILPPLERAIRSSLCVNADLSTSASEWCEKNNAPIRQ